MVDRISIRMYEVGFGDCFLLRFWTGDVATRVLIDCGSITEGQAQVDRVVQDLIATCRDQDGVTRIALVVGTHRHKDHVGGFANPAWAQVEVGEVWMPWTEDPADEQATHIRERQSSLALALAGGPSDEEPLAASPPRRESLAAAAARGERAMALNALTNEKAMATLHAGFANQPAPVFLPQAGVSCEARTIKDVEGLRVHVLGPPRDEQAMAIMDPPAGAGYLAAPGQASPEAKAFDKRWWVGEQDWRANRPSTTFTPEQMRAVDALADQPSGQLAATLDNALNNTSLILVFEAAGHWLLFPADAQWGSWNAAMQDPAARALLQKTTFYKAGHHGSHNATPRLLIEELIRRPSPRCSRPAASSSGRTSRAGRWSRRSPRRPRDTHAAMMRRRRLQPASP